MPSFMDRIAHAWDAFRQPNSFQNLGASQSVSPTRVPITRGISKSIVGAIYNRIAVDVAMIDVKHVEVNDKGKYLKTIYDDFNDVLTLDTNVDQTARDFYIELTMNLLDKGHVAIVPNRLSGNINKAFKIEALRVAEIINWYPQHVRIRLYNEDTGLVQEIVLPKKSVAILENPFYAIMNENNSTLKRLIRKLNLIDVVDDRNGSNNLNMIIQFPWHIKTERQREQAERRRHQLEQQLSKSKYGIGYSDSTEKIIQLNRTIDNQLLQQAKDLTAQLYAQLGITESIMNGTADEKTMLNYYSHTIEPILLTITDEFTRKFLSKKMRQQKEAIMFFRDPFRLVPAANLADIADRFTRNEIMSSNEFRSILGLEPDGNPRSDELINKNINFANKDQEWGYDEESEDYENYKEDE